MKEILQLEICEPQMREYLWILHDWIDELVNKRIDRVKSDRYKDVIKEKQ